MWSLLLQIAAGLAGLYIAKKFVPGVEITASWQTFLIIGTTLGILNFFLKPILKIITLPLRIITFGLFSLAINMAIVWLIDIIFPEVIILGIAPLFWTSIIIWALSVFLPKWLPSPRK